MNVNVRIMKCVSGTQNHGSESIHSRDSNVDCEGVIMCHCTIGLIKINTLSEQSPSLILGAMSERGIFSLGGVFDWYGSSMKADILVLVIFHE